MIKLWCLLDDSGQVILGTVRADKPSAEHFAKRPWIEFSESRAKVNQCAETCERADLCATCGIALARAGDGEFK